MSRSLLTRGNGKTGESIHLWSLPPVESCPGRSSVCSEHCFGLKHRYQFPQVKEKLAYNMLAAQDVSFADRMVTEINFKGCMVVRVHCVGDFVSRVYALKWLDIMKRCKRTEFYFYTRSWRITEIKPVIDTMSKLSNCRAWMSTDSETGFTSGNQAYLQTIDGDTPKEADLIFRIRKLRKLPALPQVCPAETIKGGVCGTCKRCL